MNPLTEKSEVAFKLLGMEEESREVEISRVSASLDAGPFRSSVGRSEVEAPAPIKRYTRAELEALPVLSIGQADDLHVEDRSRGIRIWLSRDAPYVVEVEQRTLESTWVVMDSYPASD